MRLLSFFGAVLIVLYRSVRTHAGGDFAAVPGTGWTDISQLSSTCGTPGYFTNPSDCSRFYVCVDHSTPEHNLLLRYDFECPGGLAFDDSTNICNYPGPSGCVSPGSGWSKDIWQSNRVSSKPSWGTQVRGPVQGSRTIIRVPGRNLPGTTIVRVTTTPPALPANPRLNVPAPFLQVPSGGWESLKINPLTPGVFKSAKVTSDSGGWEGERVGTVNPGVFESVKVTSKPSGGWEGERVVQLNPGSGIFTSSKSSSGSWGGERVVQVNPNVFQSTKLTQVPQQEWETPPPFPINPQTVFQNPPSGGWDSTRYVTPTPAPANPSGAGVVFGVTKAPSQGQSISWQTQTNSQGPSRLVWNGGAQPANPSRVTWNSGGAQPANPSIVSWSGGSQPANPSHQFVQGFPSAANPTLNLPSGLGDIRFQQLPSGYAWQTNSVNKELPESQSQTFVGPTPSSPTPANPSVNAGTFGIIQQLIKEEQKQQGGTQGGKSHIQLIYEQKEELRGQVNQQSSSGQQQEQQQQTTTNEIDSSNPLYNILNSPGSPVRGRIIVFYAPAAKGGKREAVPVFEIREAENQEEAESGESAEEAVNKEQ